MKNLLRASAMVVIMAAPAAFAQTSTTTTETSVSPTVSGESAVSVKRSQSTVDSSGAQVERSRSYTANPDNNSVNVKRAEKVTNPDGSQIERSKTFSNSDTGKVETTTTKKKTADGAEESSHVERTVTPK